MSKLLERIVYNRLYSFLEKSNMLYESQYGFRKNRSCQNAITQLISNLLKNNEIGLTTADILLT